MTPAHIPASRTTTIFGLTRNSAYRPYSEPRSMTPIFQLTNDTRIPTQHDAPPDLQHDTQACIPTSLIPLYRELRTTPIFPPSTMPIPTYSMTPVFSSSLYSKFRTTPLF
ncbi:hypothetical protein BC938DRAFT_480641 [Jimgerdemannia flammicorona]|uniref:Uncharacterized protein n=1 Tax=Jimgerdemannia flammicorona TaxID=994334 RepID=A0A433QIS7_9FUNG|nr:hypothetical protein BC938DRAFT_480641 [Jimgerdemannia flammicorona]